MLGTVLLIEDDEEIAQLIALYLRSADFEVFQCRQAEDGLEFLERAEVLLLDINLPGMSGWDFLRLARQKADLPILVVSALESDEDKLQAYGLGADDFITKPFSPKILTAKVLAHWRRVMPKEDELHFGPFTLSFKEKRLLKSGAPVKLSRKEAELLEFLARHPGIPFKPEDLYHQIWKNAWGDLTTVPVHIQRLRRKLGDDPANPRYIETVFGLGYRFLAGTL